LRRLGWQAGQVGWHYGGIVRIPSKTILLCALGITLPIAAVAQDARSDSFLDSDGVRIRYLTQGNGPPVLLLHGSSLGAELIWVAPGTLDSLATRYTGIAPDQRGHGASEKPRDPEAYGARFVEDAVRLLDHLGVGRAHVIGYSMGGLVTLNLMTRRPWQRCCAVRAPSARSPSTS
jgi:pimeloyl-ACP methyl ester carboxylesterase